MKIIPKHFVGGVRAPQRCEGGSATVIFIALLAIMMILVTAETRALIQLRHEVKFMEQQQLKRLNGSPTNNAAATTSWSK
jgi:hypothetical protein